jgi:uncharacterized protein (DUF2147 family)
MAASFLARTRARGGAILLGAALAAAPAGAADGIVGTWLTEGGASKVKVAATKTADGSPVYAGKVVWLKEPTRDGRPVLDANNADPALRSRPVLGLQVLAGFKPAAGGWSGGTVYSPKAGKAFAADLALTADGRLELKVKAGLLSRTDYWTH